MLRLVASFACLGVWLLLLFLGWTLGGVVYLLFFAALILFPWREAMAPGIEDS